MTMTIARRAPVRLTDSPRTDLYVSLSTVRLLAADVFVVGVVDGTGRLAEPTSLLTTTNIDRARRHANSLVARWGGVADEPDLAELLPKPRRKRGRIEYIERPQQTPNGRYIVRWFRTDAINARGKRFDTEREAVAFHAQLTQEMENHR